MVLGWLVLKYAWHDLVFKHVGLFYDNTTTVAWDYKGSTSKPLPERRLMHILSYINYPGKHPRYYHDTLQESTMP